MSEEAPPEEISLFHLPAKSVEACRILPKEKLCMQAKEQSYPWDSEEEVKMVTKAFAEHQDPKRKQCMLVLRLLVLGTRWDSLSGYAC